MAFQLLHSGDPSRLMWQLDRSATCTVARPAADSSSTILGQEPLCAHLVGCTSACENRRLIGWRIRRDSAHAGRLATGNHAFVVCPEICRGLNFGHPANVVFAVCRPKQHTAKESHTANEVFAMCHSPKRTANSSQTASLLL